MRIDKHKSQSQSYAVRVLSFSLIDIKLKHLLTSSLCLVSSGREIVNSSSLPAVCHNLFLHTHAQPHNQVYRRAPNGKKKKHKQWRSNIRVHIRPSILCSLSFILVFVLVCQTGSSWNDMPTHCTHPKKWEERWYASSCEWHHSIRMNCDANIIQEWRLSHSTFECLFPLARPDWHVKYNKMSFTPDKLGQQNPKGR